MDATRAQPQNPRPHVVIIGGGFGGLTAAKSLRRAPVRVTLIDRSNHHLFQPLLYQVAMAGLSPAEIAMPIRSILRKQKNAEVLLAEVSQVDLAQKELTLRGGGERKMAYDYLILAAGAETNYFNHPEWAVHAHGLKDVDDATEIRRRVLVAFEAAERCADPARKRELLTFVVIGGGPTGCELAGAIAELSRYVLARDFRRIDPRSTRVILIESGPAILSTFDPSLQKAAAEQLAELGVEVRTNTLVTDIDARGVRIGDELIAAETVIWGAGVRAAPLVGRLGVPTDRGGRVVVQEDCSLPGHPEVFAIGDNASFLGPDGRPLPGVSPVAMQQARFVARRIAHLARGGPVPAERFRYFDKGSMATIGRSRAVAEMGRIRLAGFIAWLAWLFVHIFYLIGFRNRLLVLFSWAWSYFTYRRGARLITGRILEPDDPAHRLEASLRAPVQPTAEAVPREVERV